VVLVVSEESGAISLAFDGKIFYDLSPIDVTLKLKELLDRGDRKGEPDAAIPEISRGVAFGSRTVSGVPLDSPIDSAKE